jgi:hypothetical protein
MKVLDMETFCKMDTCIPPRVILGLFVRLAVHWVKCTSTKMCFEGNTQKNTLYYAYMSCVPNSETGKYQ